MRTRLSFILLPLLLTGACLEEEPPSPLPQMGADGDLRPATRPSSSAIMAEDDENPEGVGIAMRALSAEGYDRRRAVTYARYFAEDPNPKVAVCRSSRTKTEADCTNFVSQALWYGGLPQAFGGHADSGWWYGGSCDDRGSSRSWRQVNRLIHWLVVESDLGEFVPLREALLGDLIFYRLPELDGSCTEEFVFHHATMITGYGRETGVPLVSYHSRNVRDIPWNWSLRESGFLGLGDACAYAVVHIRD